jgi:hypothetical protein
MHFHSFSHVAVRNDRQPRRAICMRSYRQLTTVIQTMRAGKSSVYRGTDQLVSIYDRIARKGSRGNS